MLRNVNYLKIFKNYINTSEAIFVNSGSSADLLAIAAITKSPEFDIKKGDKVLVSHTGQHKFGLLSNLG